MCCRGGIACLIAMLQLLPAGRAGAEPRELLAT
jgi:hypothetical protein